MIRRIGSTLVVGAALFLGACSSEAAVTTVAPPSTPTSGWLTVQLTTPNNNDGAVQLSITGPAIDSVSLVGYDGFSTSSVAEADLVVTGSVTNGDVARIHIPDLTKTSGYQASVTAAAASGTYALQSLDGYRAVLVR